MKISQEDIESLVGDIQDFYTKFYVNIAGSTRFEILPFPDENGDSFTKEEVKVIEKECEDNSVNLIYRISYGDYAVIFNPRTQKQAIIPEGDEDGFYC